MSLASMSEAKHKCRSSSGVLKETRTKNFRTSNITIMQKTMCYFGTIHITLRMTIMLSIVGALKKEGGDSRTVAFVGKVENPWLEANNENVPKLVVFENRDKIYFR